jgi:hypothetical protein
LSGKSQAFDLSDFLEYSLERLNETYKHARKMSIKKHRRSSVLLSFRASQGITGENMR